MRQDLRLRGLGYLGGKGVLRKGGLGRWITSQLPYRTCYAEPFAGMLGVLLQRKKSVAEVVSDVDGRVKNWWQVIGDREMAEEFARRLAFLPQFSEWVWVWARENLDASDPVDRAVALTVNLSANNRMRIPSETIRYYPVFSNKTKSFLPERVWALHNRMWEVSWAETDALGLLDQLKDVEDAVVYCDPPYRSSVDMNRSYSGDAIDYEAMTGLLLAQRGLVAVSGRGDDWDCLGWWRQEFREPKYVGGGYADGVGKVPVVEVLWCNYEPLPVAASLF